LARKKRVNLIGFYHIINRGVERRDVFLEKEDFEKFLGICEEYSKIFNFEIFSFCLMKNHYHLLIKTTNNNISNIMKHINMRYTIYFNKKYKRVGPLWQGRFKSFYIADGNYLASLIKYIEFNPVKANITQKIGEYPYAMSSGNYNFSMLNFEIINKIDFNELSVEDILNVEKIRNDNIKDSNEEKEKKPLNYFFDNFDREKAVIKALKEGYKQSEIAKFLNLSVVAVSKIKTIFIEKEKLFEKLKKEGLFWSYDKNIKYENFNENIFIEHTLKYGDFDDIKKLVNLFGKRKIKRVWEKSMKNDTRFIKINLLIAKVFLGIDIESKDLKGKYERFEKLKHFAS
jgi:putative transposase